MRLVGQAHHHSADEIVGYLDDLRGVVDAANLTDEETALLAPTILNLLASKQMAFEQAAPGATLLDGLRR